MTGTGTDPVEGGLIESLARPGGNLTGITNLSTELGGKRLELIKEAVPKLARVAILYDAANPGSVREVKEDLPVAAPLGLTIQPWEVRAADGFEKIFAALNKQRPDGLYLPASPLMFSNGKRIASFALKSRLPSVYSNRTAEKPVGSCPTGRTSRTATGASHTSWTESLKGAKPADLQSSNRPSLNW